MSKICKKGYIEMTKKFYLKPLKGCAGSLHFPLLVSNSRNTELNNNNTLSNETINYNKTPIYLGKTWGWWQINISQIISKVINMSYWQQKTIFINFDFKLWIKNYEFYQGYVIYCSLIIIPCSMDTEFCL